MIKKILWIAIISIFIIMVPFAVSASEYTSFPYEDKVEILTGLDILEDIDISEQSATVTRAQFVEYVSNLLKVPAMVDVKANYFKDLDDSYLGVNQINYFAELGYISVGEDRLFNPDAEITGMEAYKIIANILGYGPLATAEGGYPIGYISVINNLNLCDVDPNAKVTFYDLVNLLFDMARAPLYEAVVYSDDFSRYTQSEERNLFTVYYDLYITKGWVSSANNLWFGEGKRSSKGEICINNVKYDANDITFVEKYLGREVNVLYYDKDKEIDEVFYIGFNSVDNALEISGNQVSQLGTEYMLTYFDNNKSKSVSLSRGIKLNYNGRVVTTDIRNAFNNIDNGYIYLIDRNFDGVYEYAVIKDYKNVVVGHIEKDFDIFYDKITNEKYDMSEFNNVNIYTSKYEDADFASIKEDMVLSVAKTEKDYLEILTCSSELTAVISSVQDVGEDLFVTLQGTEYSVNRKYKPLVEKKLKPGKKFKFFFNAFSEISYVIDEIDEYIIGYLIDYDRSPSALTPTLELKVFGEDNQMHIFCVNDRVVIDGNVRMGRKAALKDLSDESGDFKNQLIRYMLDNNGLIKAIDTIADGDGKDSPNSSLQDSIIVDDSSNTSNIRAFNHASAAISRIGMATLVNDDTLLFMLPSPEDIKSGNYFDEQFKVVANSKIVSDVGYNYSAYKTDNTHVYEDVIVLYDSGNIYYDDNTNIMLVDTITTELTDKGEVFNCINGIFGGKTVSFNISPSYNGLMPEEGDTIGITRDAKDEIIDIVMIYDLSQGGTPDSQTGSLWNSSSRFNNGTNFSVKFECTFGYVTLKDKTAIAFASNPGDDYLENYQETLDTAPYSIIVYDSSLRTEKAYIGNINDIKDMHSVGLSQASRILVHYRYVTIKDIIIYK